MRLLHTIDSSIDVSKHEFEIVERKGIGHPDSLADLLAEMFANTYVKYCTEHYGTYLNHWFDKVVLAGGEALLSPGEVTIVKKPKAYLFGRVTKVANDEIPVERLFEDTVFALFNRVFGLTRDEIPTIVIDVNSGVGADHDRSFYELKIHDEKPTHESVANDTVFVAGYAKRSVTEELVVHVENYVNSTLFKDRYPETGYDVKVMARRYHQEVMLTVCIPFISKRVSGWENYTQIKQLILADLNEFVSQFPMHIVVKLNTKDLPGKGFLTVYGTALDKGDYGAVGRGNRLPGFISGNRGETQEAPAGKNAFVHAGKIYALVAHRISNRYSSIIGQNARTIISTSNGMTLSDPELVVSTIENSSKDAESIFAQLVSEQLDNLPALSREIVSSDPIENFRTQQHLQ